MEAPIKVPLELLVEIILRIQTLLHEPKVHHQVHKIHFRAKEALLSKALELRALVNHQECQLLVRHPAVTLCSNRKILKVTFFRKISQNKMAASHRVNRLHFHLPFKVGFLIKINNKIRIKVKAF